MYPQPGPEFYDPSYNPQAYNPQGFVPQHASGVPPFLGNRRTHCNCKYCFSFAGLLRLFIMAILLGGIIAAACVPQITNGVFWLSKIYASTRDGYLAVACLALIFSTFLYVIFLRGCVSLECSNRIPWNLFVFFTDILWLLSLIPVSVMTTIRESNARSDGSTQDIINKGAFAAAAAFGYMAILLFAFDALYHLISMCRRGVLLPRYAQYYPEYAYAN